MRFRTPSALLPLSLPTSQTPSAAGLLLYGLQIAATNCGGDAIGDLFQVSELELTPEGEEVGPLVASE